MCVVVLALGLDKMYKLTNSGSAYVIRFDLRSSMSTCLYADYTTFVVDSAATEYTITLAGYSGTAGTVYNCLDGVTVPSVVGYLSYN